MQYMKRVNEPNSRPTLDQDTHERNSKPISIKKTLQFVFPSGKNKNPRRGSNPQSCPHGPNVIRKDTRCHFATQATGRWASQLGLVLQSFPSLTHYTKNQQAHLYRYHCHTHNCFWEYKGALQGMPNQATRNKAPSGGKPETTICLAICVKVAMRLTTTDI